jgi:hypothetical protein
MISPRLVAASLDSRRRGLHGGFVVQGSRVSLSIIVPTVGRWTLERTLDSIRPQLHAEDELIVVYSHEVTRDPSLGRGGAEKVEGMRRATGTHLAFMDDDDVYLPGALDLMRAHAADVPVIFRLDGLQRRDRNDLA